MRFKLLKNKEKSKTNTVNSNTNDNEKTRETSTGRSMVEMLGVLAIIGVLSIGGISGYTIAMRKYRANEIANLLNKYAFVLYTGFQNRVMNDPDYAKLDEYSSHDHYGAFKGFDYFYNCEDSGDWSCLNPDNKASLSSAGLGPIPSGISELRPFAIGIDKKGNTVVDFYIGFKEGNKELCQNINNLLGKLYQSDLDDTCDITNHDVMYIINGVVVDTDNMLGIVGNGFDTSYSAD